MHPQLMGAPRMRIKRQANDISAPVSFQHLVICHGCLAMGEIHSLARPVKVVGRQGQADGAPVLARQRRRPVLGANQGNVSLSHFPSRKARLQRPVGLPGERRHHHAAGVHIEPMHHHGPFSPGKALAQEGVDRAAGGSARHGEQARGLVDDGYLGIRVTDFQLFPGLNGLGPPRVGGQHPPQDGLTLALASGIEVEMMAYFLTGAVSPPKHGHPHGAHAVEVSVLQQLGLAALPAAGGRHFHGRVGKDIQQVPLLSLIAAHQEVGEEPPLQLVGKLAAGASQQGEVFLPRGQHPLQIGRLGQRLLQPAQLGLLVLAFPDERGLPLGAEPSPFPFLVSQLLGRPHPRLVAGYHFFPGLPQALCRPHGFPHAAVLLHAGDGLVDALYLSLMGLEISVGAQVVEHRGHEARPVRPAHYLPRVSAKVSQGGRAARLSAPGRGSGSLACRHHEHAKHLAPPYLPQGLGGQSPSPALQYRPHLLHGPQAKGMGRVVEGIVEPLGDGQVRM